MEPRTAGAAIDRAMRGAGFGAALTAGPAVPGAAVAVSVPGPVAVAGVACCVAVRLGAGGCGR